VFIGGCSREEKVRYTQTAAPESTVECTSKLAIKARRP
jgi:hypothetical protein